MQFLSGCCNVATRYLTNSLLKTVFFSGIITAFFGIIASLEKGCEAKVVQWGTMRGRNLPGDLKWGFTTGGFLGEVCVVIDGIWWIVR